MQTPTGSKISQDPFSDLVGYHANELEPSIQAEPNPTGNKSTIVTSRQTGRIYDGGSSDITTSTSINSGQTWVNQNLPETVQGGATNVCDGQPGVPAGGFTLYSGSDTVVAYDKRHDVWLDSTLGIQGNVIVPAVMMNIGKVRMTASDPATYPTGPVNVGGNMVNVTGPPAPVGGIAWSKPICTHVTQAGSDSPDKNWITCDNWGGTNNSTPTSKGYGNCYEEYDNNGNGNRELAQVTSDGGFNWNPIANLNTNTVPGNGNTGDVTGETTLACPTAGANPPYTCATGNGFAAVAGDTNIKVASVTGLNTTLSAATIAGAANLKVGAVTTFKATTLAAAANAGDTNIKVASVQNLVAGQTLNINADNTPGSAIESPVIASVGTVGAGGTGVTLTAGLASAHPSGALVTVAGQQVNVDVAPNMETATVQSVGTSGAAGTGVQLTSGLTLAHASAAQVNTAIKVEVDFSGGNQELVLPTNVGTAGGTGTGVTFTPALAISHALGVKVANAAANQAGHTGDIGAVPLVQPPPPGSANGAVCGRVVYPLSVSGVSWWSSNDCGQHWSAETQVLPNLTATHSVAQGIRTSLLPTSQEDAAGNIYLTWQSRSLRVGSTSSTPNDILMSTMPAPTAAVPNPAFGAPVRIPEDYPNDTTNTNDHFEPGIGALFNPAYTGANAHLVMFNYTYPVAGCNYASHDANQCDMQYEYVSSTNGGASWSAPVILAHMTVASLARTSQGPMTGDYSSAAVIPTGPTADRGIAAFAVGLPPSSGYANGTQEEMEIPKGADGMSGLPITGGTNMDVQASQAVIKQALAFKAPAVRNVPPRSVP